MQEYLRKSLKTGHIICISEGSAEEFEEVLKSPNHALDVIRRLLQTSGMILDYSNI